jgi:hypothetical protein
MIKPTSHRTKGFIGTLDRAPFDETFHVLENLEERLLPDPGEPQPPTSWTA